MAGPLNVEIPDAINLA